MSFAPTPVIIPTGQPGACSCCGRELERSYLVGDHVFGRDCALRSLGLDPRKHRRGKASGFVRAFRPFFVRGVNVVFWARWDPSPKVVAEYRAANMEPPQPIFIILDASGRNFEVGGAEGVTAALEAALELGLALGGQVPWPS